MSNQKLLSTISIPHFDGSTSQQFRTHVHLLKTIFHSLELLDIFEGKERYPLTRSSTRKQKYKDKSKRVNQILTESFSKNVIATAIILKHNIGKWRVYYKEIETYFDNTTELTSVDLHKKLVNLSRNDNESIKLFIHRLDVCVADCIAHKVNVDDNLLKSKLLDNTDGEIKTMTLINIQQNKKFSELRSSIINLSDSININNNNNNTTMSNNNSSVYNTKYTNNNRNKVFKSQHILGFKNHNPQQSNHGYNNHTSNNINNNLIKCTKCLNYGHTIEQCHTNMNLQCTYCQKYGHLIDNCKQRKYRDNNPNYTTDNTYHKNNNQNNQNYNTKFNIDKNNSHNYNEQSDNQHNNINQTNNSNFNNPFNKTPTNNNTSYNKNNTADNFSLPQSSPTRPMTITYYPKPILPFPQHAHPHPYNE